MDSCQLIPAMKTNRPNRPNRPIPRRWTLLVLTSLLPACAALPPEHEPALEPDPVEQVVPVQVNENAMLPLLGYYHLLQGMTPGELTRERQTLSKLPSSPSVQVRQAMLYGMPRATTDLARALAMLETVLRSRAPEAASLHPLAKLLATQYQERLRIETQNDRLGQQLKESQRARDELQQKIEALTDIERSIPIRPNADKPAF